VLRPDRQSVLLAELLEGIAARFEHGLVHIDAPRLVVHTDPALLTQALCHVVENAVKYGGNADVTARDGDSGLTIEVSDDGPGIPDDVRDVAFELFTRSATTTAVPGLGVGLAIARTLAGALGGDVTIVDRRRAGTLVRFDLPPGVR
jgi:signal transduction histidine kinase